MYLMKFIKLLFILVFTGCFAVTVKSQNNITIRVDPSQARGGTASEIFQSINFIPLETTKESIFGTIDQLEVFDSLIFILDKSSRAIFIFNSDGTYKTKINTGGADKFFEYFTINKGEKQIAVINNYVKGVLIYDFNGNVIKTMPVPARPGSIFYFNKNNYLYFMRRGVAYTDTPLIKYDLNYTDTLGNVKKKLHPFNAQFENGEYNIENNFITHSGEDGSCMFSMPFEYSLYQLNDTGIMRKYKFIFPAANSLPPNFVSDSSFKGKRAKSVYGNPDAVQKVRSLQTAYRLDNYLLFSGHAGSSNIGDNLNYLYNFDKGTLLSFSKVTGDNSSYYFPIMSSFFEKILYVKNKTVYSSIPAFRLFSIKEALGKEVTYPPSLNKLMTTGSKDNNPVLVVVKLRKNI